MLSVTAARFVNVGLMMVTVVTDAKCSSSDLGVVTVVPSSLVTRCPASNVEFSVIAFILSSHFSFGPQPTSSLLLAPDVVVSSVVFISFGVIGGVDDDGGSFKDGKVVLTTVWVAEDTVLLLRVSAMLVLVALLVELMVVGVVMLVEGLVC